MVGTDSMDCFESRWNYADLWFIARNILKNSVADFRLYRVVIDQPIGQHMLAYIKPEPAELAIKII
jgi:hypothetical protein